MTLPGKRWHAAMRSLTNRPTTPGLTATMLSFLAAAVMDDCPRRTKGNGLNKKRLKNKRFEKEAATD